VARAGAARQLPGIREKTVPMACPGKQPDHRFDILTSQILRVLAFQAMVAIIVMPIRRYVTQSIILPSFPIVDTYNVPVIDSNKYVRLARK
jgi:hypothetical protein